MRCNTVSTVDRRENYLKGLRGKGCELLRREDQPRQQPKMGKRRESFDKLSRRLCTQNISR